MSTPSTHLPAIAIDVGFFSVKYTTGLRERRNGAIHVEMFPSVAPRVSATMLDAYAADALDGLVIEVEPGVRHFVGKDAPNLMGTSGARAVTSGYCLSSDYKALFLGALYQVAKEHSAGDELVIDTLVAGLPLSTVYTHATQLQSILQGTHTVPNPAGGDRVTKVKVEHALVIAQPHGALIAHGVDKAGEGELIRLVLDMGGGTFDWFVAKGIKPNRSLCGAAPIGALACAAAVCDEIKIGLKDNPEIMARVDRALREQAKTVTISGVKHEMAQYDQIVNRVLQDGIEQMSKSVGSLDGMDKILVTGGGAQLLLNTLRRSLPQYKDLVEVDAEPIASNVRGFHALGMHLARSR